MFEHLTLGIIQGVVEWLPVSSEGMVILAKKTFFDSQATFSLAVEQALFLHLGTFMAALIYFRRDVRRLLVALGRYKTQDKETRNLLSFLVISTLVSGVLGWTLIKTFESVTVRFDPHGRPVTSLIGILLIGTGLLELKARSGGYKTLTDLNWKESVILGVAQGLAALPGFSRSGLTVSMLLLRKYEKTCALRLSFLMSLPIVLGGNIVLYGNFFKWSLASTAGLAASFVFGLATIHALLKVAEKINFGYFVIIFGALTIASTFI